MSLWPHLNQMDKLNQLFLKHPDLFAGCGYAIVGIANATPRIMLAEALQPEERRDFAAKFKFLPWRRRKSYGRGFDYVAEHEGVEFMIHDAELPLPLPEASELVTF